VIGDFLTSVDLALLSRRHEVIAVIVRDRFEEDLALLSRRHEVIAVIVRDRFEEEPVPLGQVNLVDPESGKSLQTHFGERSVRRYRAKVIENDKRLYRHLNRHRVRFVKIYTDEDPFGKLVKLFGGRV